MIHDEWINGKVAYKYNDKTLRHRGTSASKDDVWDIIDADGNVLGISNSLAMTKKFSVFYFNCQRLEIIMMVLVLKTQMRLGI